MEANDIRVLISVLLPVLPAFLFFRFLPNKAAVKGPFKGFSINLQGGFAGYFAVMLILLFGYPAPPSFGAEAWQVQGTFRWSPVDSQKTSNIQYTLQPPLPQQINEKGFALQIVKLPDNANKLRFPQISFEGKEPGKLWTAELIDLEKEVKARKIDVSSRFIDLGPITLSYHGDFKPYDRTKPQLESQK